MTSQWFLIEIHSLKEKWKTYFYPPVLTCSLTFLCENLDLFQACDIAGAADDDDDEDNDVCARLDFNLTSGDFSQTQASASSQGTMIENSIANDFMGDNLVAPPRKVRFLKTFCVSLTFSSKLEQFFYKLFRLLYW